MKTPRRRTKPTPAKTSSKAAVIRGALGFSAPLIAVLHSPALAANQGATRVLVGGQGPMLDPPALIAAGTAIAGIGAYRLMRMRGRKRPDGKDAATD